MIKCVIFDLDGTLVDTRKDIMNALNKVLVELDKPILNEEQLTQYIGNGAKVLLSKALNLKADDTQVFKATQRYIEYYKKALVEHSTLYPYVKEILNHFTDRYLCVLSNKPIELVSEILKRFEISGYFKEIFGGDSFPNLKPNAIAINHILTKYKVKPTEAVIVGDSEIDIETAINAGISSVGVSYGYRDPTKFRIKPTKIVDSLNDLTKLF